MNADHDLERRIAALCASEAPTRAPDWVLESALATIDTTRQRRALAHAPRMFPTMNSFAKGAIAVVAVIAVAGFGLAALWPDVTTSGEPMLWTPERLSMDWPGPVRSEPGLVPVVHAMRHGDNTHWDEGGWEGLEFPDPMGDVPRDLPWLDIVEVGLSPQGIPSFRLTVAGDGPRPIPEPASRWIAYGMVLDIDADGAADVRIGIDNTPTGEHRAWRTELETGVTLSKAGPPYGAVGQAPGARVGMDTYYPGEPDVGKNANFWYSLQEGEREYRFYAWASLIDDGRVVATDYAPDLDWLEVGDQPGLPLVGPIWTEEAEFSADAASSAPDGEGIMIVASLEFTADGRVLVDTGCSTGSGTLTLDSSTLRINDLSLSEPTCSRTNSAAFDARMRAFLSANEFTYAIETDVLELSAGPNTLRLRGAYDPRRAESRFVRSA